MSKNHKQTNLDAADIAMIGMAAKNPMVYMASATIVELIKLPFKLLWALSEEDKPTPEEEAKAAAAQAKAQAAKRDLEARTLLAEVKQEEPRVYVYVDQKTREIWMCRGGVKLTPPVFAYRVWDTGEGREVLRKTGINPDALLKKIKELEPRYPGGAPNHRKGVNELIYLTKEIVRDDFRKRNPGQEGRVEIEPNDFIIAILYDKEFLPELDPIWKEIRAKLGWGN